ncbi:V-type proton ATPase 116 kDa subunit a1-like isoform X5 [Haliotis rufescens]|uniref:V-type proton ATPase 116 kDa subunit a1-like isoform X5 n=1 Tax=Haliotis rufescens TaxID=6454 RepID=UPI001EAFBE8B|nr:V-type proton ATPase 116 kDa subunit a1-like isoform X5 [Haliotis rufescens]
MGTIFRSEEMSLCQLFLQSEAAYACVSELGELGLMQFKDLNHGVNAFQRKFVNEVRRCEEMERKLRYIEKEIKKEKLKIPDYGENPKAPAPKEMVDLEATYEKIEGELREVNTNAEALKRNFLELTELREVLIKTQNFFSAHRHEMGSLVHDAQQALNQDEVGFAPQQSVQLGFLAGCIPREKLPAFERMLWFACRGNVFLRYEEIQQPMEDPVTGDPVFKSVFIIFFQGEQLKARVKKICEGFKAALYPCPDSPQEREEMLKGVSTRLEDLKMVLNQTQDHRHRVLVGAQKEVRTWIIKVEKIKAIYHTLNMFNFDVSHNSLIAEGWCPVRALEDVQMALKQGEKTSGSTIPTIIHPMKTRETPPTFFRTNKFTKGFQNIVDAYGIASYREVNPAPYAIITFPFLFAVMFGDAGHGSIMFMFGLWMIISEKKLLAQKSDNEIWNTFFGGRYIITLMGLFSTYTGVIYNDAFSKSFNIFGSAWRNEDYKESLLEVPDIELTLDPALFFRNSTPYPLGIDPIWQLSDNKITFLNSFKMKTAVILGISQMLFGIILGIFNHIHFRSVLNILVEFIPEVIFLLSLFGYLVSLVYFKWITFDVSQASCAPALLIQYINMFMFKYTADGDQKCNAQLPFYKGQQTIQTILLVAAVACVPVMLLVKPFVLRSRHNKKLRMRGRLGAHSTDALIPNEIIGENSSSVMCSTELSRMSSGSSKKLSVECSGSRDLSPSTSQAGDSVPASVSQKDISVNIEGATTSLLPDEDFEDDFEFGEIFIHQVIHTIEFCLGCISHTASYLRLWALSLAHAQLSEVLWQMVFSLALKMDIPWFGSVIVFVLWIFWANLTIAVLLVMEGLSAFLHTLRLHWVEFQSKFYVGDGYSFNPFSFKFVLDIESLEDIK